MILHAGLLAVLVARTWRGVLVTGPSGSGKSDLALRLIDEGFCLVADDRVILWASGGDLYGRAPSALAGLIEARGVGIARHAERLYARIDMIIACTPGAPIERLPEPAPENLLGLTVPRLKLDPFEASTPAKLRRALSALG